MLTSPRSPAPSQLRWTTRDGRVAETRWGGHASYDAGWVRFPADERSSRQARCVLDANGRRACGGRVVEQALQQRERDCHVPVPDAVPYRVIDDGPWAELVVADVPCGIRADDRSLHCFRTERGQCTWGVEPASGYFGAYRMPIEGRVIGVFQGQIDSQPAFFASTEDGALYQWDLNNPPRVIRRFDAPVVSVAHAERVDFARLRDGRVFARGLRSVDEWWRAGRSQDEPSEFVEVEALHGARIFAASRGACALDAEQRVRCWGYFRESVLGPQDADRHGPVEIRAYRGATDLLVDFRRTCARMRGMQLLCAGPNIDQRWLPGRMRDGFLRIDLDRIRPDAPGAE